MLAMSWKYRIDCEVCDFVYHIGNEFKNNLCRACLFCKFNDWIRGDLKQHRPAKYGPKLFYQKQFLFVISFLSLTDEAETMKMQNDVHFVHYKVNFQSWLHISVDYSKRWKTIVSEHQILQKLRDVQQRAKGTSFCKFQTKIFRLQETYIACHR